MDSFLSDQALFIHDQGGGSWEWCVWAEIFEQYQFETHTITLEPSKAGEKNTSSSDYAQQLIDYIDNHKLKQPILVGAGMGGKLALKLYHQVNPSALILINPLGSETFSRPLDEIDFTSVIFDQHDPNNDPRSPGPEEFHNDNAKQQLSRQEKPNKLGGSEIPDIYCPCLLLIGEQSNVVPPETGNELAEKLNAEVISFGGVNHISALLGIEAKAIARHVCQTLLSL